MRSKHLVHRHTIAIVCSEGMIHPMTAAELIAAVKEHIPTDAILLREADEDLNQPPGVTFYWHAEDCCGRKQDP